MTREQLARGLRYVVERAREPSSWAGVAVLLGLVMPQEVAGAVASIGAGLAGLAAVVMREGSSDGR